jgi:hypothetical protein
VHGDLAAACVIALHEATRGMSAATQRAFFRALNAGAAPRISALGRRTLALPPRPLDDLGDRAPHAAEVELVFDMRFGADLRSGRGGF